MIDYSSTWDDDSPDGRNELLFGNYSKSGVIAVTIIWGYFSGPPPWREIIEFDILFDTDYTWGDASTDTTVMDLQNIATHELGHGFGLADLYESSASEETMIRRMIGQRKIQTRARLLRIVWRLLIGIMSYQPLSVDGNQPLY